MSRLFASASTQFLRTVSPPISAYPFSISAWFYPSDTTGTEEIAGFHVTALGANHLGTLYISGSSLVAEQLRGLASVSASASGVSASTWQHGVAVFVGTARREVYLDGSGQNDTAFITSPMAPTNFSVGARRDLNAGRYFDGRIADVAVWSSRLFQADVDELARGRRPWDVQNDSLVGWWPLVGIDSPEIDTVGSAPLTLQNAPTQAEDPPLWGTRQERRGAAARRRRRAA